jgi:PRC-barrel domain protein
MADPASWKVVERGWRIVGSDGAEVGYVDEIVGDSNADIFSGIAMSEGVFKGRRLIPSEHVAEIVVGEIRLDIPAARAGHLDEYDEPPPQEEILAPDPKR